jgi:hypothetical protein
MSLVGSETAPQAQLSIAGRKAVEERPLDEVETRGGEFSRMMFSLMSHLRRSRIVLSNTHGLTAVGIE